MDCVLDPTMNFGKGFFQNPQNPIKQARGKNIPGVILQKLRDEKYQQKSELSPKHFVSLNTPVEDDPQAWKQAIYTAWAQEKLAEMDREIADDVITHFNEWIDGKSKDYNLPVASSNKDMPSWWGRRKLVGKDFDAYKRHYLKKQQAYIRALQELRWEIPDTLPKAWIYFLLFVFKWPDRKTADKLYLDEFMTYFPGWVNEDSEWADIDDPSKTMPVADKKYTASAPQDYCDSVPRTMGGSVPSDSQENQELPNMGGDDDIGADKPANNAQNPPSDQDPKDPEEVEPDTSAPLKPMTDPDEGGEVFKDKKW